MFTRLSNFTYDYLQISNVGEVSKNNNLALTIHIQKYEKECLRMILGDCLYADLMNQVELDGDGYWKLKTDVDSKWDKLLNGDSYDGSTFVSSYGCGCCGLGNCGTHYWDGIVKQVASIPQTESDPTIVYETIMAPYIYMKWALNERTRNFGTGEGNGTSEGATQADTSNKRADAWNEMVQNVAVGGLGGRVSLQQYLREHATDFPEALFLCYEPITYWL